MASFCKNMNMDRGEVNDVLDKAEDKILNFTVMGHPGHGRNSLEDLIISEARLGIKEDEREVRYTKLRSDTDNSERIQSSSALLAYSSSPSEPLNILNLHTLPSLQHFQTLDLVEGALLIVSYTEGAECYTENYIMNILNRKITPILFINQIDIGIKEGHSGEDIYIKLNNIMELVNDSMSMANPLDILIDEGEEGEEKEDRKDPFIIDHYSNNVIFGSALDGWGFNLSHFAQIYCQKFKIDNKRMMDKLWGENYFDAQNKMWKKNPSPSKKGGTPLIRCFAQFIMNPIINFHKAIMNNSSEKMDKMLKSLNIDLSVEEREKEGKNLYRCIFKKWMNLTPTILSSLTLNIPTPQEALRSKASILGFKNGEIFDKLKECRKQNPCIFYISKFLTSKKGKKYAFGRVFSGVLKRKEEIEVIMPDYQISTTSKFKSFNIPPVIFSSNIVERIEEIPCGMTGVGFEIREQDDKSLPTIQNLEKLKLLQQKDFVVKCSITSPNKDDLLIIQSKSRNLVEDHFPNVKIQQCIHGVDEIYSISEEYLNSFILEFKKNFSYLEVTLGEIEVINREIATSESPECSGTKEGDLNLVSMKSLELNNDLKAMITEAVEDNNFKERFIEIPEEAKLEFLDSQEAYFDTQSNNLLTLKKDETSLFKEKTLQIFKEMVHGSSLSGCEIHNTWFQTIQTEIIYEENIELCITRAMIKAYLSCNPRIQEPILKIEVLTPYTYLPNAYEILAKRDADFIDEERSSSSNTKSIIANLPAQKSLGLNRELLAETEGRYILNINFSHWKILESNPLEEGSEGYKKVKELRQKNGLEIETMSNIIKLANGS